MSTKEKIISIINGFSEEQLNNVLTMLESLKNIVAEAEDDAYCNKLYNEYKSNPDDTSDNISIEDFASELGVTL